jgi:hypothetical protein
MLRHVEVGGQQHEVEISQPSKNVWVATGVYMGSTITMRCRSAGSALMRWREAAQYRGN